MTTEIANPIAQNNYQPTNVLAALTSTITNADSYKVSHFFQYPEGTEYVSSYIESRSSQYAKEFGDEYNYPEFFGLQAFLKDYLSVPVTQDDIDLAEILFEMHGEPFNKEGWQHIVDHHGGKLPIEIRALPEGTVAETSKAMVEIKNTDPKCFWLTSYVETSLLRAVWYPTTVATQSRVCKDIISEYLEETSTNPDAINFMLHDFGARGASSTETSALGGMAHLTNFMGTDTVMGMLGALRHYYSDYEDFLAQSPERPKLAMIKLLKKLKEDGQPIPGYSVIASEHSTMTIEGRAGEKAQIKKLIDEAKKGKIVSIVSDSYDYWGAVENLYGGEFREDIKEVGRKGGKVVIRPDSGNPVEVVVKTLQILAEKFAEDVTVNDKKKKVLPPYIGVIQGDGIDPTSMRDILKAASEAGFSAENIVFGMGGGMLQKVNRDKLNFAQKASNAQIRNQETGELENFEIFKDPATADPNFIKKSKRGELSTIFNGHAFDTKRTVDLEAGEVDRLQTVFLNGEITKTYEWQEVRANADYFTNLYHNPPVNPITNPWQQALAA